MLPIGKGMPLNARGLMNRSHYVDIFHLGIFVCCHFLSAADVLISQWAFEFHMHQCSVCCRICCRLLYLVKTLMLNSEELIYCSRMLLFLVHLTQRFDSMGFLSFLS